jgi:hypothetical protein
LRIKNFETEAFFKGGDIDWGDSSEAAIEDKPDNLNYVVDDETLKDCITVEETGVYIPVDGIAKDDDALTILEFQDTRNSIYHDLIRVCLTFNLSH